MYQKFKLLIPVIILLILCLLTIMTSFSGLVLTVKHYLGFSAVIICIVSFFVFRRYYKYVLTTTLILGLLNLINFTPGVSTASFHINSLGISFQPISFLICILTVVLFRPQASEVKVVNAEQFSVDNQKRFNEDIEKFKNMFINKSTEDLSEILTNKKYTAAALSAAQQILDERQHK